MIIQNSIVSKKNKMHVKIQGDIVHKKHIFTKSYMNQSV